MERNEKGDWIMNAWTVTENDPGYDGGAPVISYAHEDRVDAAYFVVVFLRNDMSVTLEVYRGEDLEGGEMAHTIPTEEHTETVSEWTRSAVLAAVLECLFRLNGPDPVEAFWATKQLAEKKRWW